MKTPLDDSVTAVITTSPIPFHPCTASIDAVYGSIRHHFPACKILILADGVRPEQQHLRDGYEEYKSRLRRKNWTNVQLIEFSGFHHQAGMIRKTLQDAHFAPLILWVEHDLPLNYMLIDWQGIIATLLQGEYACIRFCHDADLSLINRPHQCEHFRNITGEDMQFRFSSAGVPLLPVLNWDTQPHIATTDFYRYLAKHFQEGKSHVDCDEIRIVIEKSFSQFKIAMYAPQGDMKRFEGLPGRGNEPKYPMTF